MTKSSNTSLVPRLKRFILSNQLAEYELQQVEKKHDIELGISNDLREAKRIEQDYYSQIETRFRKEAKTMAPQYELFYSLEKSIRSLIAETLEEGEGVSWWSSGRVSEDIREDVKKARRSEEDSGITSRSDDEIDYCTFGHLSQIIEKNWDLFGSIFRNPKAVKSVMYRLNTLRNPIAHCALLADDEILRLNLTMRDWFRQME